MTRIRYQAVLSPVRLLGYAVRVAVPSLAVGAACSSGADKGDTSFSCFDLGGGYGGADLAAIGAECWDGGGTGCDADTFIEMDAAKCIADGGQDWSDSVAAVYEATIRYDSAPDNTVVWSIHYTSDPYCGFGIRAADGEILDRGCAD